VNVMATAVAETLQRPRSLDWSFRRLLRALASGLGLALAIVWALLVCQQFVGGPMSYVMVSGTSMEPLLHTGDLAVVLRRDSYEVGDVVAYHVPQGDVGAGALIIHRIVHETRDGFVYRGDNRDGIDLWQPTEKEIEGALWLYVPHAGLVFQLLRAPLVLGVLAAIAAFVVVLRRTPRA
jgi:signal peptidase I